MRDGAVISLNRELECLRRRLHMGPALPPLELQCLRQRSASQVMGIVFLKALPGHEQHALRRMQGGNRVSAHHARHIAHIALLMKSQHCPALLIAARPG